ncbi:MAG: LamG domain-containing protein [Deltaproteobacteria bacterium]|nr:LamG domain-containing protein [Deltaproteobacteria bacterium]
MTVAMRIAVLALPTIAACGFTGKGVIDDATPGDRDGGARDGSIDPDGPTDAIEGCPPDDDTLRLCFTFDQATFANPLPNEGAASVSAQHTAVTRSATATGGAAEFLATSGMYVAPSAELADLRSLELWFRPNEQPALRFGLLDNDASISVYYYTVLGVPQVRCSMGGGPQYSYIAPYPASDRWIYLACVCNGTTLEMYLDGMKVDTYGGANACSAGNSITSGLAIGQNSDGTGAPANESLEGALDTLRIWSVTLPASTICRNAGRTDC